MKKIPKPMSDTLVILVILGLWIVLQTVVLPRMGVST